MVYASGAWLGARSRVRKWGHGNEFHSTTLSSESKGCTSEFRASSATRTIHYLTKVNYGTRAPVGRGPTHHTTAETPNDPLWGSFPGLTVSKGSTHQNAFDTNLVATA